MARANASNFSLWRPLSDPAFPWLGVLIASPIIGIWYWCTDQYIVQRALSAKNLATARRGALFGGLLKVWPVLIFLIPGMIGWALHQKGLVHLPTMMVNGVETIKTDLVFATLVRELLPTGIRGLIVACLLAALMSSLASLFNSSASLFTVDIYQKLRPGQSDKHLLNVGRVATTVVVIWGCSGSPSCRRSPAVVSTSTSRTSRAIWHRPSRRCSSSASSGRGSTLRAPPGASASASSWG